MASETSEKVTEGDHKEGLTKHDVATASASKGLITKVHYQSCMRSHYKILEFVFHIKNWIEVY